MHEVAERIAANAEALRREAAPSDESGRLTDRLAELVRESGVIRLLQPTEWGGYRAHPNEFLEQVMALGAIAPSAGWVAGVVGVHPWEIAMMDPRLQEEIWDPDPDTWTASPYAPFGRARSVDGGYLISGRWPYSTGTDHARWAILGGIVEHDDPDGRPDVRHFVFPREDYEIVEGTWNVLGLRGTGSKDVRVTDAFVPEYRVVDAGVMTNGGYEHRQNGDPLYRLKFPVVFSAAIASATLGIAEGALAAYRDHLAGRVTVDGSTARKDPIQLVRYGESAADIAASRSHLLTSMAGLFAHVSSGGELTKAQRLVFRRDQVRAVRRAVDAIDALLTIGGSAGIRDELPIGRYWRDLHTAATHMCNVAEGITAGWAAVDLGDEAPRGLYA